MTPAPRELLQHPSITAWEEENTMPSMESDAVRNLYVSWAAARLRVSSTTTRRGVT
jgi:hypothetical protein